MKWSGAVAVVGFLLMIGYAVGQFVAAIWGLESYIGWFAMLVIPLCIYFRFTLPITVFAFLGAKNEWGWHWLAALVFVAPGLLLIVPALLASAIEGGAGLLRRPVK